MSALEQLVSELAVELAPLVAAEVAASVSVAPAEEPWRLLTLKEAAARLGRSERWVRDRVKLGQLVNVRLDGGALAFELAALKAFVAERRVEGHVLADRLQVDPETCL